VNRPFAQLVGTGRYTPSKVHDNAYFEKILDTSDQWIRERTGISERRISEPHETIAYMGTKACMQVLDDAAVPVEDVDAIIVATASPDRLLPSTACDLQAVLGAKNAGVFDIQAACSGFIYGLTVAEGMIAAGNAENILVVGGERLSSMIDYTDRTVAILLGDGVGATLVRPADGERGILSTYIKSDGTLGDLLYRPGGGASHPPDEELIRTRGFCMRMAGREVFKSAVLCMSQAVDQALQRAGLTGDDIDLLIPHQANIRIIEATAKHASVPMDKVYVNIDRYGNTSSASIPIALDECVREGRIKEGSVVLFVAFGGGFTWGSVALRW
jgi:3-oxoacyl-[acyl-carrier-protein] synthase-3